MAKINISKLHVAKPHTVDLTPSTENRDDLETLRKELKELNERNAKALDRFRMIDGDMYKLILDNMLMQSKLVLRMK
jgi:hypothetical protein